VNDYLTIFETGLQYTRRAETIAKGGRFPEAMSINMVGLAAEALLASMTEKYDLYVPHVSVGTLGQAIMKLGIVPESVHPAIKLLSVGCAICNSSGNAGFNIPPVDLYNALEKIKDWVSEAIHQEIKN